MTDRDLTHEMLSAYVDGMLAPEEAAVVARRAAEDESVARRIAMLQSLRAGVAALAPDVVLPKVDGVPSARRQRFWWRLSGAMAAAVLLAALVGAGWQAGWRLQPQAGAALTQMIASHDAWRGTTVEPLLPAGIASPRTTALMAATGLRLVHEEVVVLPDGGAARHSGYLGSNGCRLSLFEIPVARAATEASMLAFSDADDLLQASWQIADTRYVMIARSMDSVRFATIASSVRAAAEAAADEADLMAALEGARQRCLA
jgi:anti-sigma factor RsiW